MKLLQINSVYEIASTGRTSYELEKYLETRGWECHMAYADGTCKKHNGVKLGNLNSHRIHSGLAKYLGLQGFFSPFSTWKLLKYIKKVQPDVIHLRNLHSNYIAFVPLLKYSAKKKIPIVITLHDFWFFTGGCCFPMDYGCEKWKAQCSECPENKRDALLDPSRYVFETKIKLIKRIPKVCVVGVSKWACSECGIIDNCNNVTKRMIYNWIDFDKFHFRNIEKSLIFSEEISNKFIVLGVATIWNEIKGLNDFLKLSQLLEKDIVIVLIGQLSNKIQLPNNIINIPTINDVNILAEYYSVADVFVSMAYRETFGKTIAEAMSCGCPAIVYDVTACKEIVGEGCGEVVNEGNVSAVYESILRVKKNSKKSYYSACISHTRELFDYNKNAEMYNQLYRELLEKECNEK